MHTMHRAEGDGGEMPRFIRFYMTGNSSSGSPHLAKNQLVLTLVQEPYSNFSTRTMPSLRKVPQSVNILWDLNEHKANTHCHT